MERGRLWLAHERGGCLRKAEVGAGEMLLVRPGAAHWEIMDRRASTDVGWIGFYASGSDELAERLERACGRPMRGAETAGRLTSAVFSEWSGKKLGWEEMIDALLGQLTIWISRQEAELRSENLDTDGERKAISVPLNPRSAAQFIEAHCRSPLSVEETAWLFHMSAGHFSRQFKRHFGAGPKQYQLRARIRRAKELLRSTEATSAQVAALCGFHDEAHFSRAFQSLVGTSPGVYRRRDA